MPRKSPPRKKSAPRNQAPQRSKAKPPKPKPSPAAAKPGAERLQKVLAAAGIGSRRECELFITEGRVEVDNEVVIELGAKVDPAKQKIHVDGELLPQKRRLYFAVNKPEGYVSTARDPSGRPRVIDLVPPDAGRLFNVGRLDLASEGLILVTNDGELANQLTHPRHGVEKTYHVQVAGLPTVETLATLRKGVRLAEGKAHFVNAKVKSRKKNSTILEVVLDEGRNREIRRVLARVGHKVQRLTRIAVGPVRLGELPSGACRPLRPAEIRKLQEAIQPGKPSSRRPKRRPSTKKSTPAATTATAKRKKPAKKKTTTKPAATKPKRREIIQ